MANPERKRGTRAVSSKLLALILDKSKLAGIPDAVQNVGEEYLND